MTGKVSSSLKQEPLYTLPEWYMNDDIVISGMAGRFPESENVEEFEKNLYNHLDMITEDDRRWRSGMLGTPKGFGKIPDLEHFDAMFFGVHGRMAAAMDPAQRILLEVAYETLFDAGIDPLSLGNRNIGVYVGSSGASVPELQSDLDDLYTGYEALGNSPAMMANRTSYTFDITGPSFTLDTGCSSSMFAINEAILAMRTGRCEAAIVAGCTLIKFFHTAQLNHTSVLSVDSRCKTYDKTANGFVRSEAIAAIFLQKKSDAKRCYASVLNCRINNDGRKVEGIMFPSAPHQKALILSTYNDIKMDPRNIEYLESHGTGNMTGDKEEGRVIGEVFCPNKGDTMLVASVKSNIGHTEASSGVCSLIKVLLSFENGLIPANLHYKVANPEVKALVEGRMKIVSENLPFHGGIVGVSNFGFGGGNSHMIVKSFDKEKKQPAKGRRIPRVVTACGTTSEAVKYILDTVREKNFTDEGIVLLEDACKTTPTKMKFRGYTLFGDNGPEGDVIQLCSPEPRPVWFLFSGMGSQWSGMSKQMMRLEPFAKSIRDSAEILRPLGIDLVHLVTEATEEELNHIVYPFVTIAAVQIALTDMLRSIGLKPDGIIGHSVGELGCAYADGTFTAKQMLLASYWRGKSCVLTQLIDGRMAAIGMTWEEAKQRCPSGVFPVCHNAQDSVTISGPTEDVEKFVKQLKDENIFARTVKTGDIAFHSKYVEPASILMRKELEKVIPDPVPRSKLWVSSSVPEEDWDKPKAKLSSVDYHINNLLSPVLFNEAMTKVPKDALIIEIAPHCLLQPIVKRILGPKSIYVGLSNKNKQDNLRHFLGALGSLYNAGLNPEIKNLYDPVTFPVPRGTPMLNSLIKWDRTHWKTWTMYSNQQLKSQIVLDTIKGGPYDYILDHKLDGRIMYTAPGYLWLAWKSMARLNLMSVDEFPVMFENVILHRAVVLPKSGIFTFNVKIQENDGNFFIYEADSVVASGFIKRLVDTEMTEMNSNRISASDNNVHEDVYEIDSTSFYRDLRLRGYEYAKSYQCVKSCDSNGLNSVVQWNGNWVPFIESVFQIALMHQPVRSLALVTSIRKVKICPNKRPQNLGDELNVSYNSNVGRVVSQAVEVEGLNVTLAPRRLLKQGKPVLEEVIFVPFMDNCALSPQEQTSLDEYTRVCTTVAARALKSTGKTTAGSTFLSGSPNASDALVNKYLQANDGKHVLLHTLHDIEVTKKVPDMSNVALGNDLISSACMSEHSFRACLDCFLINAGATKFNVLEISNKSVISPAVEKFLKLSHYGHIIVNTTVARTTKEPLPADVNSSVILLDNEKLSLPDGSDLLVAKGIFTTKALPVAATMNAVAKSLKDNGFAIFMERTAFTPAEKVLFQLTEAKMQEQNESDLEKAFENAGLTLIAKKKDGSTFVTYLVRKLTRVTNNNRQVFRIIEDSSFKWIEDLKVFMKQEAESDVRDTVWLVDDRPETGIYGMMLSIMKEFGGSKFRVFCNANLEPNQKAPKFDLQSPEIHQLVNKDLRFNAYRNGEWGMFSNRTAPREPKLQPSESCYLDVTDRGDLSSLKWIQFTPGQSEKKEVQAKVVYSGLNQHDVMMATGKIVTPLERGMEINNDGRLGLEYSGLNRHTGRRVMGLVPFRGLANIVSSSEDLTFEVPAKWSLEDAATVPLAYVTAYHALVDKGRLENEDTVLVHSASGPVGQASITIALARGCKVIATVESEDKKKHLVNQFRELQNGNVLNHTEDDVEDLIMKLTSRNGVDVVLSSSADLLDVSIRCLKRTGRYLDVRTDGTTTPKPLCSAIFSRNIEFHGINMMTLLNPTYQRKLKLASEMLRNGVQNGEVKPLNRTVFTTDQVVEAFRYIEPNTHTGKVVLQISEESKGLRSMDTVPTTLLAQPKLKFSPEKSVIVTGGLGGMGFELIFWLIEKGVKKIVISSRSGLKSNYQRYWMQRWNNSGLQVKLCHKDITTNPGCRALLNEANKVGPVGSIFHLAVVLRDGLLENMTPQDYVDVGKVKVSGTRNLDECSRDLCPELEHFVCASSVLASKTVGGLGNYAYGNSAIERVCEMRRKQGFHGLAVEYGVIGDAGIYFDEFGEDSSRHYDMRGTILLTMAACFLATEKYMMVDIPVGSYFSRADETESEGSSKKDLLAVMCNILGVSDPSTLQDDTTLGSLGMDSLMVVEAKQLLDSDYNTPLSIPQVLKLSINDIKKISSDSSKV